MKKIFSANCQELKQTLVTRLNRKNKTKAKKKDKKGNLHGQGF